MSYWTFKKKFFMTKKVEKKNNIYLFLIANNFNTTLNLILKFCVRLNKACIYMVLEVRESNSSGFRDKKKKLKFWQFLNAYNFLDTLN